MHRHINTEHECLQLHQGSELPRFRCRHRQENTHPANASSALPPSRISKNNLEKYHSLRYQTIKCRLQRVG